MDFKDYYKTLGLAPDASADDIKRTYKKLARKYHPDVSDEPDAQAKFQEVSEAYEVLRNKEKRAEYDELREYVNNPNAFRQGGGGEHFRFDGNFSAEDQFEDLLRSIFGDQGGFASAGGRGFAGPGRGFPTRGQDIHYRLGVSLEEAYHGGTRNIRLAAPGGDKTIAVKIPKGVLQGKELRLKGQGESGRSGEAGDLYLEIAHEKHPLYSVEGNDIVLVLPVAPWEAALGTSVQVPTLGGKVNLKIPPNSQNGARLRLKGRGLGDGDQFVLLKFVNPRVTNDAQRKAFEALDAAFDFDPRAQLERQS
ncbi:MAG: DnaJ C-terminal domain-containing protein [Pseudomonadota bacterium]